MKVSQRWRNLIGPGATILPALRATVVVGVDDDGNPLRVVNVDGRATTTVLELNRGSVEFVLQETAVTPLHLTATGQRREHQQRDPKLQCLTVTAPAWLNVQ